MGRYRCHVFVCTWGNTMYPDDVWCAGVDVHGAERIVREHLIGGRVVQAYRYYAPPGDNELEAE